MDRDKKWGILCYVPIANVIFCPIAGVRFMDSLFLQFHVRQGAVLFLFWLVNMFLAVIFPFLGLIMWVILLVLHGVGIGMAATGQTYKIPLIGDLAMKIPADYFLRKLTTKAANVAPKSDQDNTK